jgi:hypothetical protein
MPSIINSDDGVVSGSSGLKNTGGNDGILVFQSSGAETARITSGVLSVSATSTTASTVRLYEDTDNGANYVDLVAPTSITANRTLTLPDSTGTVVVESAAVSAAGQVLFSTNGSTYTPTAKIVSGTAVGASGTDIEFTGIPPWVKRVTVMLADVSTTGTSPIIIQIGAGSFATTSYSGTAGGVGNSGNVMTVASYTNGFGMAGGVSSANQLYNGNLLICLVDSATGLWAASGSTSLAPGSFTGVQTCGGSRTLSGTLDRVRITTSAGAATFSTGTINLLWE